MRKKGARTILITINDAFLEGMIDEFSRIEERSSASAVLYLTRLGLYALRHGVRVPFDGPVPEHMKPLSAMQEATLHRVAQGGYQESSD